MNKVENVIDGVEHYNGWECYNSIKQSMTKESFLGALKFNVMKYLWRYEKKQKPVEDLKKARQYLDKLIEEVEK